MPCLRTGKRITLYMDDLKGKIDGWVNGVSIILEFDETPRVSLDKIRIIKISKKNFQDSPAKRIKVIFLSMLRANSRIMDTPLISKTGPLCPDFHEFVIR